MNCQNKILNSVTVVYGYSSGDFSWKNNDDRKIFRTSGLIASIEGKKYVVTTREQMISCKTLIMYHLFKKNGVLVKSYMHILFQSIENNLIILGSVGYNELILDKDNAVSTTLNQKEIEIILNKFKGTNLDSHQTIPTNRSLYHINKIDLGNTFDNIKYKYHTYDIKFNKQCIFDKSYLPKSLKYKFICQKNINSVGTLGTVVYSAKNKIIGITTHVGTNKIYVTPTTVIISMMRNFIDYFNDQQSYKGQSCFPFKLKNDESNNIIITVQKNKSNKKVPVKNGDVLRTLNGYEIIVNDNEACLCVDSKNIIPLDIYFRMKYQKDASYKLTISRGSKIIKFNLFLVSNTSELRLTDQTYYFPKDTIPHVNLFGLIVVKLSHELIDYLVKNGIIVRNYVIENIMNGAELNDDILIILDSTNELNCTTFNFPILTKQTKPIDCPVLTSLNHQKISNLENLSNVKLFTKGENILTLKLNQDSEIDLLV